MMQMRIIARTEVGESAAVRGSSGAPASKFRIASLETASGMLPTKFTDEFTLPFSLGSNKGSEDMVLCYGGMDGVGAKLGEACFRAISLAVKAE